MSHRVAIAGFQHETNTFAPLPTALADFERGGAWPALTRGPLLLERFPGLNIPLSGFIGAAEGLDLVPLLWASAEPAGYVAQEAFERIAGEIVDALIAAGPVDALYLDLHGAMVTEALEDGEGALLARIRDRVGPDLPIVVSLDLHGNLTEAFFQRADAVAIYRTYPHIDMAETGARAAALLKTRLERGAPFAKAFRQLDYLIPITAQSTMHAPAGRLYGMLDGLAGADVASVDFAFGFPPADIRDCGATVLAYGSDQTAVDAAADRMHAALAAAEAEFHNPMLPAAEAAREAIEIAAGAARPVVIADPQDNPGAGAVGDSTGLIAALIEAGAEGAVLGMVWDPDTARDAHAAGPGGAFFASIGGRFPAVGGPAIEARVRVEALSDGDFLFTGPFYGGARAHLGRMACLRLLDGPGDIRVVVGSVRAQNADQEMFREVGIEPARERIVAVKSAVHFLADYEPIAETVLFAEAPGANPCRLERIPYTRLRPGVRLGPGGPAFGSETAS